MGVSINAQNNKHSEYVFSVKQMCRILLDRSFSLKRFDILYPLFKDFHNEKDYLKVLHTMTNNVIKSRKDDLKMSVPSKEVHNVNDDSTTKRKLAFLDLLLKAQNDGQDISDTSIREEVDTFMFEVRKYITKMFLNITYNALISNLFFLNLLFDD